MAAGEARGPNTEGVIWDARETFLGTRCVEQCRRPHGKLGVEFSDLTRGVPYTTPLCASGFTPIKARALWFRRPSRLCPSVTPQTTQMPLEVVGFPCARVVLQIGVWGEARAQTGWEKVSHFRRQQLTHQHLALCLAGETGRSLSSSGVISEFPLPWWNRWLHQAQRSWWHPWNCPSRFLFWIISS